MKGVGTKIANSQKGRKKRKIALIATTSLRFF
jgi:hypothetical protein